LKVQEKRDSKTLQEIDREEKEEFKHFVGGNDQSLVVDGSMPNITYNSFKDNKS
jgi:hypothetical protein